MGSHSAAFTMTVPPAGSGDLYFIQVGKPAPPRPMSPEARSMESGAAGASFS